MATATKTVRLLLAPVGNAPGATTSSPALDESMALGLVVLARITNGTTGPTIPCDFVVQVSNDGGVSWRDYSRQTSPNTANTSWDMAPVEVPAPVSMVRVSFQNNTGQTVTVEAYGHELTSVG
jgi:hypothetical protein